MFKASKCISRNLRQLVVAQFNTSKNVVRKNSDWNIKKSRSGVEGYDFPPLTESLKSTRHFKYPERLTSRNYDTDVSQLDNGLKVASEKLFGEFCTVGVIIDAGPRYETPFISGTTHFLEKLAFNSTANYISREEILEVLEKHGAICDCQSGRDAIIYALSCRRSGLPEILNLLADTIYRPLFQDNEIEQVRKSIEFELEDLNSRPDPEPLLVEMLHEAAFGGTPLANAKLCPSDSIKKMSRSNLYSYMKTLYLPKRTVLTCIGTDHNEFVALAKQKFQVFEPIWKDADAAEIETRKSVWTGGYKFVEKDLSDLNQGSNNQLPELTHLVVGLESPNYIDERDFVTSCVINTLMGGGGSFSAGGPGKGMYSRLYLNVLNRYHFMFSATAYNQSYMDSGIFYIHASCPPQYLDDMCNVVGNELVRMTGPCNPEELSRAKTQLQSMLFMNLEQRPVLFEDVARQVLSRGRREQAQYYFDRIEAIQEEDVQRVSRRMLESAPAVVAYGRLCHVDPYEKIKKILSSKASSRARKLLFR